jgi:spermidine/putrescine-binding protein
MLTRRHFFFAGAALVAGCRSAKKSTLRVFVYAGGHEKTMREVFVPRFEAASGAEVELQAGWWDGIAKLKAAPVDDPPFDLIISDATQGYPAVKEGLFAKLNLDNIPNHKRLTPSALDNRVFRDGFGITFPDSVMTLAFNKESVGKPPTRWADLLRPDLDGKLGLYNLRFARVLGGFAEGRAA